MFKKFAQTTKMTLAKGLFVMLLMVFDGSVNAQPAVAKEPKGRFVVCENPFLLPYRPCGADKMCTLSVFRLLAFLNISVVLISGIHLLTHYLLLVVGVIAVEEHPESRVKSNGTATIWSAGGTVPPKRE